MKTINILGSTGTVGVATLDVVKANPDLYSVGVLSAQSNVAKLAEQAKEFRAGYAIIGDETLLPALKDALSGTDVQVSGGREALIEASGIPADCTMAAIVGMAGLEPLLAAIKNGRYVAIANKEPLVSAGVQVLAAAQKSGATLLPVDSEHNAVFQVFESAHKAKIERIILTASGGPFRTWTREQMEAATPAQAVSHPNWSMGAKISVDSATMMNKALEVIEARWLFDLHPDQIKVVIHPQQIIHSMVQFNDASILAQLGTPDMRVPIACGLSWPERITSGASKLDFSTLSALAFEDADAVRFPGLHLSWQALKAAEGTTAVLNAANEVAVDAFLSGRLRFDHIHAVNLATLDAVSLSKPDSLAALLDLDTQARHAAEHVAGRLAA